MEDYCMEKRSTGERILDYHCKLIDNRWKYVQNNCYKQFSEKPINI